MKRRELWKISVLTSPESEEAVTELVARVSGEPPVSHTDLESGVTEVATYLRSKPHDFRATKNLLRQALDHLATCGLNPQPARIRLLQLQPEDWAESWKRHFKPISLGKSLLIRPSWDRRKPREGQAVLTLDPGLSFGTGHHPTTLFCLRQIIACRNAAPHLPFLDIGTGSGILALAAAKLDFRPVEALDHDPDAIQVARTNARLNQLSRRVRFSCSDLSRLPRLPARTYALICANLIAPLLLAERTRILARLAPGGRLVLAGILRNEFPKIQAAYQAAGLYLVASHSEKEWRSGAFEWKP